MRAIVNATVFTMTAPGARAEAIAYDDAGRIVAVGSERDVLGAAGAGCAIVDGRGRAVVPGFIDAHHHLSLAVFYAAGVACGADVAPDIPSLAENVRRTSATLPPGAWVLGQGYDEALLAEQRHPTRAELDAACPDRPALLLHYSCHEGVANSRALALAGIDDTTPDPPGGIIRRDRRGRATGHLIEAALSRVEILGCRSQLLRGPDAFLDGLAPYEARLFAAGLTRVVDPGVTPDFQRIYQRARDEKRFRIPIVMMPISANGFFTPPSDRLDDAARTGDGPEDFRVGPMKLVFDGGQQCAICMSVPRLLSTVVGTAATAIREWSLGPIRRAMNAGPRFGPGGAHTGILFYDAAAASAIVRAVRERGFTAAIHACGNEAIVQAIEAHGGSSAGGAFPARIEHATMVDPEIVKRLAGAGVCVVAQPSFVRLPAVDQMALPGNLTYSPLRSLLDAGVRVAGSSDAPCLGFDVLASIRDATRRRSAKGRVVHEEEATDVETALAMYTREAAWASGASDVTGTLERGKRADLVVLSGDPCAPGAELSKLRVVETVLAGETVFAASC